MKLLMCKGLPGSGKTTFAKTLPAARINKDDLRSMLFDGKWTKEREKHIVAIRDMLVGYFMLQKMDVVVDDTNLAPKHEARLRELAKQHQAEFDLVDLTEMPIEECIKQDLLRPKSVGEKVIRQMYRQFIKPTVTPPEYIPGLRECIICDLDGTLALLNGRDPYNASTCIQDHINEPVYQILLKEINKKKIIFVSGREDKHRDQTRSWLKNKAGFTDFYLYMRPTGDFRKDFMIKQEIYEKKIKGKFNVAYILDDRNQVVEMWRSQGLTCLQVADGNF